MCYHSETFSKTCGKKSFEVMKIMTDLFNHEFQFIRTFKCRILWSFLLWKAKYFHFLHHIYKTCNAMQSSRVLETSKPPCFPFTTVFKGPYSKLNGNTALRLWAVWELQPHLPLWCRKNTIPVMVLNTADSNATKLHHLMICFFSQQHKVLSTLMQGNGLGCQLQTL